jgi:putative redox protein
MDASTRWGTPCSAGASSSLAASSVAHVAPRVVARADPYAGGMSDAPHTPTSIPEAQPGTVQPDTAQVDTLRSIGLTKIGEGRFKATNARGGETFMGSGGTDPDFTPVELLLAAIAGCSAIDVDLITRKRSGSTTFELTSQGHKVRDEQGNHMTGLRLTFDVQFPEGPEGDAARAALPRAIEQSRDRLCTVSRTVQLGTDIAYERA